MNYVSQIKPTQIMSQSITHSTNKSQPQAKCMQIINNHSIYNIVIIWLYSVTKYEIVICNYCEMCVCDESIQFECSSNPTLTC